MAQCSNCGLKDSSEKNSANLLSFMLKDVFTDFIIIVEQTEFPAHRSVLAAISPVLRAMLQNDLKQTNCMTISNFGKDTVENMISFIYNGGIGQGVRDCKAMCDLLRASEVYGVTSLKTFCVKSIKGMITEQNVIQVIIQADLCNALDLKTHAIDYFLKNPGSLHTCDLDKICKIRPNLYAELMEKLCTTKPPENNDGPIMPIVLARNFATVSEVLSYFL